MGLRSKVVARMPASKHMRWNNRNILFGTNCSLWGGTAACTCSSFSDQSWAWSRAQKWFFSHHPLPRHRCHREVKSFLQEFIRASMQTLTCAKLLRSFRRGCLRVSAAQRPELVEMGASVWSWLLLAHSAMAAAKGGHLHTVGKWAELGDVDVATQPYVALWLKI